MARRTTSPKPISGLSAFPWWVNLGLGLSVYFGLPIAVHLIAAIPPQIASTLEMLKWGGVLFLFPTFNGFIQRSQHKRFLLRNRTWERISTLDWREFEALIDTYYSNRGFRTKRDVADGADGGVDVRILDKRGRSYLVQCKHWKVYKVGVKIVRELFGVVTAENAKGGIVVTSGTFTPEARKFAKKVSIELIDGDRLIKMLSEVNTRSEPSLEICPKCKSNLVLRQAKRGKHAGEMFYGCSSFPKCRYTRETK